MKYLSLFSGIGGFELGILNAHVEATHRTTNRGGKATEKTRGGKGYSKSEGSDTKGRRARQHNHLGGSRQEPFTCVGYSEIDKYAVEIYQKRFPDHKNYGDITKIKPSKLPDFDLLVGGFPCQAFSIAGKRKGFKDTRGTLFFDIARILRSKKPRLFVLENVKGLLSHDSGNTFKTIISTLAKLGYDIQWQVLNSKNFGVPQNRERVFIIGHLRGTARPKVFPIGENSQKDIVCEYLRAHNIPFICHDHPAIFTVEEAIEKGVDFFHFFLVVIFSINGHLICKLSGHFPEVMHRTL
jgi:DNA (cytosine-5)-methyltransferase 1